MSENTSTEDIFLFLDNLLNPTESTKRSNGEVLTPIYVVKEMCDAIEKEIKLDNPKLKIIDPTAGLGNYQFIILERLMENLKKWQPDEKKRKKHILENMIYYAEYNQNNYDIYRKLIDPNNEYKLNVYRGDTLSNHFLNHMQNVWKVKKFDIIIGNPPYNEDGVAKSIYHKFINFFIDKCDYMSFIVPKRFLFKSNMKDFKISLFERRNIKLIVEKHKIFKDAKIRGGVIYYVKTPETQEYFTMNGKRYNFENLINEDGLVTNLQLNIINKVRSKNHPLISNNYKSSSEFNTIETSDKRIKFGDEYEDNKDYIKVYTSMILARRNKSKKKYGYIKKESVKNYSDYYVFTPGSAGHEGDIGFSYIYISKPNEVFNQTYRGFKVKNLEEAEKLKKYLELDFVNFLLRIRKTTQLNGINELKYIPQIDLDNIKLEDINETYMYKYFNITNEENNDIKAFLKINNWLKSKNHILKKKVSKN